MLAYSPRLRMLVALLIAALALPGLQPLSTCCAGGPVDAQPSPGGSSTAAVSGEACCTACCERGSDDAPEAPAEGNKTDHRCSGSCTCACCACTAAKVTVRSAALAAIRIAAPAGAVVELPQAMAASAACCDLLRPPRA